MKKNDLKETNKDNDSFLVKQVDKRRTRSYAPAKCMDVKKNSPSLKKLDGCEPVYLNLFEINFEFGDDFKNEVHPLFEEQIVKAFLSDNHLQIEFNENIDNEHKMITYSTLSKLKFDNIIIPCITISIHNKKGDIFYQKKYINAELLDFSDNFLLDYSDGTAIFSIESQFFAEEVEVIIL